MGLITPVLIVTFVVIQECVSVSNAQYLGCFKEDRKNRLRAYGNTPGSYEPTTLTVDICRAECGYWNYEYAALTQSSFCFCGHSNPTAIPLPLEGDGFCDWQCAGDPTEYCGGFSHVSVYKTSVPVKGLFLTSTDTGTKGLLITETNQPKTFDVTVDTGPSDIVFAFDYGAGKTDYNASGMYSNKFTVPGEHPVTVYATDESQSVQMEKVSTSVLVQAPAEGVELFCPPVVVVGEEFTCNASIRIGNRMKSYIDYGDGTRDDFPIPDAMWDTSGTAVPQHSTPPPTPNDDAIYMSSDDFVRDGELNYLEFYVNSTGSGDLQFLLMKPSCGTYCSESNSCTACSSVATCTASTEVYCPAYRECVPGGAMSAGTCSDPDRTGSRPTPYEVTVVIPLNGVTEGWNYEDVTALGIQVQAGNVVGVYIPTGGAILGTRSLNAGEIGDTIELTTGIPGVTDQTPISDQNYRVLARAHATKKTWLRIFHTYNEPNEYTISVTGKNDLITGSASNTSLVSAQVGINSTELDCPSYWATGSSFTCTLKPHTGSNITYEWNITNVDTGVVVVAQSQTTQVPTATFTVAPRGNYSVFVRAYNDLSDKNNITATVMQNQLGTVVLSSEAALVNDASHRINASVASGSDYSCVWNMGDGSTFITSEFETIIGNSFIAHNYSTEGDNVVSINCSNMVSFTYNNIVVQSRHPITNLRFSKTGTVRSFPSFAIEWEVDLGTVNLVDWSLTFETLGSLTVTWDQASFTGKSVDQTMISSGQYLVTLSGSNPVSTASISMNYTVDTPITGLTVTPDAATKLEILRMESITFVVDMAQGSSVEIDFDWNDGSAPHNYIVGNGVDWPGSAYSVVHVFQTAGMINVSITVRNNLEVFQFSRPVGVLARLENLTLTSDAPVPYVDGKGTVKFQVVPEGTPPAGLVYLDIDFGDGYKETGLLYDPNKQYPHTYNEAKTYSVVVNASNVISYVILRQDVTIVVPVCNMFLHVNPPHAPVGQPVEIGVSMDKGNDVTLSWNFDYGDPGDTGFDQVGPRIGDKPWDVDRVTHTYTVVKVFTIAVQATNPLGNTTIYYTIHSQNPVNRADFTITTLSPAPFPPGTTSLALGMVGASTPPTDASVLLSWGDGTTIGPIALDAVAGHLWNKTYSTHGHYSANVTIYNKATTESFTISTGVYEAITGLTATAFYQPLIPFDGPLVQGKGPQQIIFPAHLDVHFVISNTAGTIVTYSIDAVHHDLQALLYCTKEASPATMRFGVEGKYNVTILAANPLDNATYNLVIEIRRAVSGITIEDSGTVKPRDTKTATLGFQDIGSDACIVVDWGDNTKELYANDTACKSTHGFDTISGTIHKKMDVRHVIQRKGNYIMRVNGYSFMGDAQAEKEYVVSNTDCNSPFLTIFDQKPLFYKPRQVERRHGFSIVAEVDLDCSITLKNIKKWVIERVNPTTGEVIEEIQPKGVYTNTEIATGRRELDHGVYKYTFSAQMDDKKLKEVFISSISTYVEIIKSPLRAMMVSAGTTTISAGYNVAVSLSPGKFSRDLDLVASKDQGFTSFEWYCRQIDEKYPTNSDGSLSDANPSAPKLPGTALSFPDNGGCFRDGPGRVDHSTGELTFNTINMHVNETYEFLVVVGKDSRTDTAKVNLHIVPGNPPVIYIGSKDGSMLSSITGLQVDPTKRMALKAWCDTDVDESAITYQWEMFRAGLNGAWLIIENFTEYVISAPSTGEVSVSPKLFEDGYLLWSYLNTYRVSLKATLPDGSVGEAAIIINLNNYPAHGHCTIEPKVGYVMTDSWAVKCDNWTDPDNIGQYQFFAMFTNDTAERHLAFGTGRYTSINVPLGPSYDNHLVHVYARVLDTKRSATTYLIDTVQALPPTQEDELLSVVDTYTTGDKSELTKKAEEANLHDACKDFVKVASALNTLLEMDKVEFGDLPISAFDGSDGYGPQADYDKNKLYKRSYLGPLTDEERMVVAEEKRNYRAERREIMAKSISKMTKTDTESCNLASAALGVITEATDELTLETQKAVAESTLDMVSTLSELADETPKEELLQTVISIVNVIGNVLEASGRNKRNGIITDEIRSKKHKLYKYDTDWETDRDNFDGLMRAQGLDGLMKETSGLVQIEADPEITGKTRDAAAKMTLMLLEKQVQGEEDVSIRTRRMAMTVAKDTADKVVQKRRIEGRSIVTLPNWCSLKTGSCDEKESLGYLAVATPVNPYAFKKDSIVETDNHALDIELRKRDGSKHDIKDTQKPILFTIPNADKRRPKDPEDVFTDINTDPIKNAAAPLMYTSVNITKLGSFLVHTIRPENPSLKYLVVLNHGSHGNVTHFKGYDQLFLLPHTSVSYDINIASDWVKTYSPFRVKYQADKIGKWYFGVGQIRDTVNINELVLDKLIDSGKAIDDIVDTFSTNYSIHAESCNCFYYDPTTNEWLDNGVELAEETDPNNTVCKANHLTSFGSSWAVQPNKIDFAYVFSNMDFFSNPTLYITEILIALIYIIVAIWARRQDKKDILKLGVTPLPDNEAGDRYLYEIVVSTGMRKNAGTDSKVHFIISGENDETDVRVLADTERKILRRGATDSFLMAVPRPLGALNYMRMWHDNNGKGKFQGWYLNHIMVQDIQTKHKWAFIANEWFAVEESDGLIDRLLPVAGPEQMTETGHLFSQKATRNLSDDHLWFSVIARPPESRFTRLQRVSCVLVLLFSSMLANAMFYEKDTQGAGQSALEFGPFALTPEQIYIGVISNLVVFPINFILVFLFRRTRPKRVRRSRIQDALDRAKRENAKNGNRMDDEDSIIGNESVESYTKPLQPDIHNINTGRPMTAVNLKGEEEKKETSQVKKKFSFPWWVIIIAWTLLWLSVLTCAAFVTFYGVQFGDLKCKKWITSMVISFFTSVFLTQPIKVFFLALIFSMVCKKTDDDDEGLYDEAEPELRTDEIWLHEGPVGARERKLKYIPPDPALLEKARINRLKELQMFDILREVLFYALFLWILMVVSYGFRDPNAFFLKSNLYSTYVDAGLKHFGEGDDDLSKSRTMSEYFNWAKNTLVHGLRAEEWYNGIPPIGQRGMVADRNSRIMGWGVLRQLRIKPNLCETVEKMRPIVPDCYVPYSISDEDETPVHDTRWRPVTGNSTQIKDHFRYRTAKELDGWPLWAKHGLYSGGGYVVELRGDVETLLNKIKELESDGWLDRYTRAVIMEITTYNAQVNLFGITTLVAEFMKSGGIDLYYRIEPVNLLGYYSSAMLFQIACEIIYLVFILFFIIKEIRKATKGLKEYLKEPWNYIELAIILLSVAGVAIYFYRLIQAKELTKKFKETHGNAYMKFQYVGYWNELLLYMLGWLVFFATVKFIRLLRFNKRMNLLGQTLRHAARGLVGFGMMFTIVFMAYSMFFYNIYFMDLYNFSTLIYTMETCLQMLVGKFNFNAMQGASPVLGPATFFCYVVTVYYILINMFLTILNESFASVRADVNNQSNEHEMVEFMVSKFKQWTGLNALLGSKKNEAEKEKKDYQNKTEEERIDEFPNKIEQLLESLSKAYHDRGAFDSLFYSSNSGKGKDTTKMGGDGTGSDFYSMPRGKSGMAALRQNQGYSDDGAGTSRGSPDNANPDLPNVD